MHANDNQQISTTDLARQLQGLPPRDATYATRFVDCLLNAACARVVSDVHLTPSAGGLDVRWRVDGVLEAIGIFATGETANVVARLKVLADLLTYRQETPQEGRLRVPHAGLEMRISTFPTLFGERAVVRIFRQARQLEVLDDLGLPSDLVEPLRDKLHQTLGAIIVTGPAGSGKTTTTYACLRELLRQEPPRSVLTLEDPIESVLAGAAQSAMQPAAGFDFATALRSVMRQDPEVILVGEVRDRETAMATFQAALTGHLVLTTFHAGTVCAAVSRLNDMGIEPYLLRSGVQALLGQRLVRKLCGCATTTRDGTGALGLAVESFRLPGGCEHCASTGYRGRMVLVEMLPPLIEELGGLVLAKADAPRLQASAQRAGMIDLWQRALAAVAAGETTPMEIRRALGIRDVPSRVTD